MNIAINEVYFDKIKLQQLIDKKLDKYDETADDFQDAYQQIQHHYLPHFEKKPSNFNLKFAPPSKGRPQDHFNFKYLTCISPKVKEIYE